MFSVSQTGSAEVVEKCLFQKQASILCRSPKKRPKIKMRCFFCFRFSCVSRLLSDSDEFLSSLGINTHRLGQPGEGEEKGARMWSGLFWQNRFHGCFMLHRPLVFCLAAASHNVNLKQGGFGAGVLI